MTERREIDVDTVIRQNPGEYNSLLTEARKQAREAAEDAPSPTRKKYWVKDSTLHWRVEVRRHDSATYLMLIIFLPIGIPYFLIVLPIIGFYKTWSEGSIPLPNDIDLD